MKYADVRITMTISFEDDGVLDLKSQALGDVKDTEFEV